MDLCDFGRSFMTWDKTLTPLPPDPRPYARHMPWGGAARIQLDSLLYVTDEVTGTTERYVLIAPCRGEWMWVDEGYFGFMPDHGSETWVNSEYRMIYSDTDQRFIGRRLVAEKEPRRAGRVLDKMDSFEITVRTHAHTRLLETAEEMIEATRAGQPLVGRTTLHDSARRERYVLEYPIKTMNFHPARQLFQVDTGPLIVPDFASTAEHPLERLDLAHMVFNRLDRAEFIARRPTPIVLNGHEVCRVPHYSHTTAHDAQSQLFAAAA